MQMIYGGGLAVGAGPLIRALKSMPLVNKDIEEGLVRLADSVRKGSVMENYYVKTRIPRGVYLLAAHTLFRRTLKENGQ